MKAITNERPHAAIGAPRMPRGRRQFDATVRAGLVAWLRRRLRDDDAELKPIELKLQLARLGAPSVPPSILAEELARAIATLRLADLATQYALIDEIRARADVRMRSAIDVALAMGVLDPDGAEHASAVLTSSKRHLPLKLPSVEQMMREMRQPRSVDYHEHCRALDAQRERLLTEADSESADMKPKRGRPAKKRGNEERAVDLLIKSGVTAAEANAVIGIGNSTIRTRSARTRSRRRAAR